MANIVIKMENQKKTLIEIKDLIIPYSEVLDPLYETDKFTEPLFIYQFLLSAIRMKIEHCKNEMFDDVYFEKLCILTRNTLMEKEGYYHLLSLLCSVLRLIAYHTDEDGVMISSYSKFRPLIHFASKYVTSVRIALYEQMKRILK